MSPGPPSHPSHRPAGESTWPKSVICISRGSYGYGKELAEKLAAKIDALCIGRETITDEAADYGIPVGKLEMAVLKHRPLSVAMGNVRDMFKAYVAAYLSERALDGDIVYHGRTGHLVLHDVKSVLRVRTIDDMEPRIERIVARLRLSRDKAKQYALQVDEDRKRWVRRIYNVDWDDPSLYDVILNAAHVSSENSASVLVEMAGLPEFQTAAASRRVLQDIVLSSRCRLAIGKAESTRDLSVTVQANRGVVSVTYPPHQAKQAAGVPAVLEKVDGIESVVCTVATTHILYIGDHFDPSTKAFGHLVEIADKWNAAVDLVQLGKAGESAAEPVVAGESAGGELSEALDEDHIDGAERGTAEAVDRLIQTGRAGRVRSFKGGVTEMIAGLSPAADYSMIVVGDVFSDKVKTHQRLKRNLIALLADKFRIPVLGGEELKAEYLFGGKQLVSLIASLGISALVYLLVFSFQEDILQFLSAAQAEKGSLSRTVTALAVVVFVPLVALSVGSVYKNILKFIKME